MDDQTLEDLQNLIKFCTPDKESMRLLRIAGPTWRHFAAGKKDAYEEVVEKLQQIINSNAQIKP